MQKAGFASLLNATAVTACLAALVPGAGEAQEASATPEASASVLLSQDQYRQSILDIFGPAIELTGRFEPGVRDEGMLAVGARKIGVTESGLERYDDLARGIARQVVDPANRSTFISCQPKSVTAPDDDCTRTFITRLGRPLYRRPLAESEIRALVQVAANSSAEVDDFYAGLATSLATMLISPQFLFRFTFVEPDPAHAGQQRQTAYSKAGVLSFFLWNSTPDGELLRAAEAGELHDAEGLAHQVDRMISSPRVESSVRAFFSDMLRFSDYETLAKDPTFYPQFTRAAKEDSMEQTLRTIVDQLVVKQGDYRDLFTTRQTFMTRSLAALYGIPLVDTTENGQPDRWMPYTFDENDPRVGILSQVSFVALHSPSGRSSPTDRGKAVREVLLCQKVPPPPANVDFSLVQATDNPIYKTARERLAAHANVPQCAGCHRMTDPIGLALESFDSSGRFRTTENGAPIDTSGQLNGVKYGNARELSEALRNDPAVPACVAKRVFEYATATLPPGGDPRWAQVTERFQESGYKFMELMRQVALSDLLYQVPATTEARGESDPGKSVRAGGTR
jgi:hypothetical protein